MVEIGGFTGAFFQEGSGSRMHIKHKSRAICLVPAVLSKGYMASGFDEIQVSAIGFLEVG